MKNINEYRHYKTQMLGAREIKDMAAIVNDENIGKGLVVVAKNENEHEHDQYTVRRFTRINGRCALVDEMVEVSYSGKVLVVEYDVIQIDEAA